MSSSTRPPLNDTLNLVATSAADAQRHGLPFYATQAKLALTAAFPGFSEKDYGFTKFIEYLQMGVDRGAFSLVHVDGHPVVTPRGTSEVPLGTPPAKHTRLKPDLWNTILTWAHGDRYWDRALKRAVFIPTDEQGNPRWMSSPDEFVEIDPVTMEEQHQWMREFADTRDEQTKSALSDALDDKTPGAFRRELERVGQHQDWLAFLQDKVILHAKAWAERNGLPLSSLEDTRTKAVEKKPTRPPSTPQAKQLSPSPTTELRASLHRIIDQMSFDELARIPVPAGYLLRN